MSKSFPTLNDLLLFLALLAEDEVHNTYAYFLDVKPAFVGVIPFYQEILIETTVTTK